MYETERNLVQLSGRLRIHRTAVKYVEMFYIFRWDSLSCQEWECEDIMGQPWHTFRHILL